MATVADFNAQITQLQRKMQLLKNKKRRAAKVAAKKAVAQPVSLKECMDEYREMLKEARAWAKTSYAYDAASRASAQREGAQAHKNTKDSRKLYKECCEHLIEGGTVRLTDAKGVYREFSNLRRKKLMFDSSYCPFVTNKIGTNQWLPKTYESNVVTLLTCLAENRVRYGLRPSGLAIEFL